MEEQERARIEHEIRARAKRKVGARLGFYWHAVVYVMANAAMLAINLTKTPDTLWFVWPLAGWGAALLLHAFATFQGQGMTEDMIQAEVDRELARRGLA
ncbi:MAG: 2TM domain-containing protein [Myxococcales bacterium]|jgi:hypothetical protein